MSTKNSSKSMANEKTAADETETVGKTMKQDIQTKPDKKGKLVYMGPTIAGVVRHSTAFKGGILPKKVQECVTELPAMEQLFIEVDKLPDAVRKLKNKQSALSVIYWQTVQKFLRR